MDPSVYIPAYLERTYLASHPELTDAARELVHNDISANPHKYAQTEHAQALLSYAGVHRHLLDEDLELFRWVCHLKVMSEDT